MDIGPITRALLTTALLTGPFSAAAQTSSDGGAAAAESLALYFASGSAAVRDEDEKLLDQAARLYREGNPIVMVVSGSTDTTGSAERNLRLSQQRAEAVLRGLTTRGIPAGRFQILAKGETEPAVATADGEAEAQNRRVEITWR